MIARTMTTRVKPALLAMLALSLVCLAACGTPRVTVEIKAGQQFAMLDDVRAERHGETLSLQDPDLSGRGLTGLRLRVGAYSGDLGDLAAVLNACESANAVCSANIYTKRRKPLTQWSLSDAAIHPDTRALIQRELSRTRAITDNEPLSLAIEFDVVTLGLRAE